MSNLLMAIAMAKQLILDQKENMHFDNYAPLYPFNTENSSKVFSARKDIINGNNVVTVTGSGDHILDLIYYGANEIFTFDINGLAKYYANLKIAAVKALSYEEYRRFFLCSQNGNVENGVYDKVAGFLDDETMTFWKEIFDFSKKEGLAMHPSFESGDGAKLFYGIQSIFGSSNRTTSNPDSYMGNEERFLSLKRKLMDRDDNKVHFYNVGLFDINKVIDFGTISYSYFSNIMDFFIGLDGGFVDKDKLLKFKQDIKGILDCIPENSELDLCILKEEGYLFNSELQDYYEIYSDEEGFKFEKLGDRVTVLSFSNGRKIRFHSKA